MFYIRHRINTVKDLETVPFNMGIEIDIRYEGSKLILQHDPYKSGEYFEDLLKKYKHSFIILNVKTEGIEVEALRLINAYGVKDYFFLDLSFPAIIKLSKTGENNIAVRFSEYEPLEQALSLKNITKWVWIDCFNKMPLDSNSYEKLKNCFKLCIVSPELQGYSTDRIEEFKNTLKNFKIDAICTKAPHLWES